MAELHNRPVLEVYGCAAWLLSETGPYVFRWEDGEFEIIHDLDEASARWSNMLDMHEEAEQEK